MTGQPGGIFGRDFDCCAASAAPSLSRIVKVRDLDTNDSAFRIDGRTFANYGDARAWELSHPVVTA